MNLLELMLEQNVLWPAYAQYAVQDADKFLKFSSAGDLPEYDKNDEIWIRDADHGVSGSRVIKSLSIDWSTRIITREEYQDAGGWMCWEGGERPVPKETPILYTTKVITSEPARAGACSWEHVGDDSDILAYCLTAIIPGQNQETAARDLAQLYAKLGVTTLEEAFAEIDKGIPASMGHTIIQGKTVFRDCVILLKSRQTVVWVHNGDEYIFPLREVAIDPSPDELVAYLLSGLCRVQIDPAHIIEVRKQVCWVYPENQ